MVNIQKKKKKKKKGLLQYICSMYVISFFSLDINCSFPGTVKVWDPRQKNDPVATMEPQEGETKRDCWTVAFGKIESYCQ